MLTLEHELDLIDYAQNWSKKRFYLNTFAQTNNLLINFLTGIFLASIISLISYKLKLLKTSGIIAAFLLATIIYTFGTWQWTLPIVTFFVLSSLLSKFRKKKNESVELYFEKSGKRDYMQVIANGGLASLLVILNYLYYSELLYVVFVSMIASVCADTWATEIGTLVKARTVNILSFEKTYPGISGGVSFPGIAGALSGALVIALTTIPWLESNYLMILVIIVFAGFIGSIADSILGASIQAQYKCIVCKSVTERKIHCDKVTNLSKGVRWINNDAVNFGASVSGGIFSIILYDVIKG